MIPITAASKEAHELVNEVVSAVVGRDARAIAKSILRLLDYIAKLERCVDEVDQYAGLGEDT